jgi:hypothetical protein
MAVWDRELVNDRPRREQARRSLGAVAFDAAWARGRTLTLEEAAAEAHGSTSLARAPAGPRE